MGDAKWAVTVTATVQADSKWVVAWWTHPDRSEETLARLRQRGFSDSSVEDSFSDPLGFGMFNTRPQEDHPYTSELSPTSV